VQITCNLLRQRPAQAFFAEEAAQSVAIIVRVPLASGLLTGKMTADSTFAADDHRSFNRNGAAFDKGETFSGVPCDAALAAVDELRPLVPEGVTMAAFALRRILMEQAAAIVIPGSKSPAQSVGNAARLSLPPLTAETMAAARDVYDGLTTPYVHRHWQVRAGPGPGLIRENPHFRQIGQPKAQCAKRRQ